MRIAERPVRRQADRWHFFLERLDPLVVFRVLAGTVLDKQFTAFPQIPLEDVPGSTPPEMLEMTNCLAGEVPFYLEDRFSVVVLIAWGLVPVVLGYWWFERSDLG